MTRGKEQVTGRRVLFFNAKPVKIAEKALSLLDGGGLVVAGVADPGPASPRPATSAKTFFAIFAGSALKNKSIVVRDPRGLCVENKPEHVGEGTGRGARFIWRLAIWGLSFSPWI